MQCSVTIQLLTPFVLPTMNWRLKQKLYLTVEIAIVWTFHGEGLDSQHISAKLRTDKHLCVMCCQLECWWQWWWKLQLHGRWPYMGWGLCSLAAWGMLEAWLWQVSSLLPNNITHKLQCADSACKMYTFSWYSWLNNITPLEVVRLVVFLFTC